MLDLLKGARPDERFHLQQGCPMDEPRRTWFGRVRRWRNLWLPNGQPGTFSAWTIGSTALHGYWGTCKCDGTRTRMYWAGMLDDGIAPRYTPDLTRYVMTTTPKELRALRFFVLPGEATWDNMGG